MIEFSFSHYLWSLSLKIIEDKDIISKLNKLDLIYLAMMILPNGETLLHMLANKT